MALLDIRPMEALPFALWTGDVPGKHAEDTSGLPTLTPYYADGEQPTSAVIVFPGGGYGMRAEHERTPIAQWLRSLGINAFILDYRVAPYRNPVPLQDALRAIRTVRANHRRLGVDPERIGILGFSAGGHLAATASTHFEPGNLASPDPVEQVSSRPDAAILCYPVVTFGDGRHSGSMINLLGDNPDEALVRSLSNETQVTGETPPTFIWHTADDEAVPVENALLYASALARHQVPFDLHVYEHGRHGLGLAADDPHVSQWVPACASWLRQRGFLTGGV